MKGHRLHPHQRELGVNRRQIPKTRLLRCPSVAEKARQARITCYLRIVAKQYRLDGGERGGFEPPVPRKRFYPKARKRLALPPTVRGTNRSGGERNAPAEDVGGILAYEEFLEALSDPDHKQYHDMKEWIGDFDPEYFSVEEANRRLRRRLRVRKAAKRA